jgi:hypothetical protein
VKIKHRKENSSGDSNNFAWFLSEGSAKLTVIGLSDLYKKLGDSIGDPLYKGHWIEINIQDNSGDFFNQKPFVKGMWQGPAHKFKMKEVEELTSSPSFSFEESDSL